MEKYIIKYQNLFQCLKDWDIKYSEDNDKELSCTIFPKLKKAIINKWSPFCKGEVCNMELYVKHEVFHIAFGAAKRDEDMEELFIIDLTKIL